MGHRPTIWEPLISSNIIPATSMGRSVVHLQRSQVQFSAPPGKEEKNSKGPLPVSAENTEFDRLIRVSGHNQLLMYLEVWLGGPSQMCQRFSKQIMPEIEPKALYIKTICCMLCYSHFSPLRRIYPNSINYNCPTMTIGRPQLFTWISFYKPQLAMWIIFSGGTKEGA